MDQGLLQLMLHTKRVRLAMLLVFVLLFIYVLVSYLTNGQITVNTNSPNNVISLTSTAKNGKRTTIKYVQGTQLKAAVPSGNYEISVSNKSSAISKSVTVSPHRSRMYQLIIPAPVPPVSVLPFGAVGLTSDSQQLYYLDSDTGRIYSLSDSGIPVPTGATTLDNAQWASVSFGIGQDSNGTLYAIRNGVASPLSVPFGYSSGVGVSYSVGPSGLVYVSSGSSVYSGQFGENFHKILDVGSGKPKLFAGSNKLAVIAAAGKDGDKNNVILVDASGRRLASKTTNAGSVSWSPNGNQLAIIDDWAGGAIYDTSLNRVTTLGNGIGGVVWLNNSALLYSQAQDLWKFDVEHGTSQILSSTPVKEQISGIFLSGDRSSVFLAARSQNNSHILLRVGLTKQAQNVPAYYSGLSVLFPAQSNQCSFSYSNFLRPVIVITAWSNTDTCTDAAHELLKADDLPVSDFAILFAAPEDD